MILVRNLKFLYLDFFLLNWPKKTTKSWYLNAKKFPFLTNGLVNAWFWSKIWSFFTLTFLGQFHHEECLVMFLIENKLFQTEKKLVLESCKIFIFYIRVHTSFLGKIYQKKYLAMFLIENELLYTNKTLILERCKICIFHKGVTSYIWLKIWNLNTLFFLVQIGQKECLATFFILKTFLPYQSVNNWKLKN